LLHTPPTRVDEFHSCFVRHNHSRGGRFAIPKCIVIFRLSGIEFPILSNTLLLPAKPFLSVVFGFPSVRGPSTLLSSSSCFFLSLDFIICPGPRPSCTTWCCLPPKSPPCSFFFPTEHLPCSFSLFLSDLHHDLTDFTAFAVEFFPPFVGFPDPSSSH